MDSVSALMRNVFLRENVWKYGSGNDEAFNRALGRMDKEYQAYQNKAGQECINTTTANLYWERFIFYDSNNRIGEVTYEASHELKTKDAV